MTYNILILFNDGTAKIIKDVTKYEYLLDQNMFTFTKNGYKSFVPVTNVSYFGREFDWEETK